MAEIASARPATGGDPALSVVLYREPGDAAIAEERVSSRDLADSHAESWYETCLREGSAEPGLSDVRARLRPVFRDDVEAGRSAPDPRGPRACIGFSLALEIDGGERPGRARFFPRESLAPVAARAARRLVDAGALEAGALYRYRLVPTADEGVVTAPPGRSAPSLLPGRLSRLLARARAVGGVSRPGRDDPHPVFFTAEALARAERVSRSGGAARPPVETGGLFFGPLCRCVESGEVFAVVEDVIEARSAEATTLSLTYGGRTWARMQAIVRARARRPGMQHHRILGQCHGHNFVVGGDDLPPCEACAHLPVCTRHSAVLSDEDRTWCRAVFAGEPWQLSQVFGLDARRRGVEAFYGQRRGSLARRGYHVIERFEEEDRA